MPVSPLPMIFFDFAPFRAGALAVLVACSACGCSAAPGSSELKPIFNGRDLTGWKVPDPNLHWSVRQGVLVAQSDPERKGSYLWTEKSYGDFDLEFDLRMTGEDLDTGVSFHTPALQMQIGVSRSLQRDMTGSFMTDGRGHPTRYPESGRANDWERHFKKGDWNRFRLEVRGSTFTSYINGQKVATYSEERYGAPGPIGLQFHDEVLMKLEFRDVRLAER